MLNKAHTHGDTSAHTVRAEPGPAGSGKRDAGILEAAQRVHGREGGGLHDGGLGVRERRLRLRGPPIILKQDTAHSVRAQSQAGD